MDTHTHTSQLIIKRLSSLRFPHSSPLHPISDIHMFSQEWTQMSTFYYFRLNYKLKKTYKDPPYVCIYVYYECSVLLWSCCVFCCRIIQHSSYLRGYKQIEFRRLHPLMTLPTHIFTHIQPPITITKHNLSYLLPVLPQYTIILREDNNTNNIVIIPIGKIY